MNRPLSRSRALSFFRPTGVMLSERWTRHRLMSGLAAKMDNSSFSAGEALRAMTDGGMLIELIFSFIIGGVFPMAFSQDLQMVFKTFAFPSVGLVSSAPFEIALNLLRT